jgi:Predicted membrane protein
MREKFMWKRSELKAPARANLKKRYWLIVLICLMMAFFCGEYSSTLTLSNAYSNSITNGTEASQNAQHHVRSLDTSNMGLFGVFLDDTRTGQSLKQSYIHPTKGVLAGMATSMSNGTHGLTSLVSIINKAAGGTPASATAVSSFGLLIYILFAIFIKNILIVGERRWFLENRLYSETSIMRMGFVYRDRCTRHVAWVMLLKTIKLFLWWCTIVGGIIKTFEYMAIPYILAENPDIGTKDTFKLAREMMKGYKWKLFVLYISFWYWYLLSTATAGLFRLFFLNGYIRGTEAEFFVRVRQEAINNNLILTENFRDDLLYTSPDASIVTYPGTVRMDLKNPLLIDFNRHYTIINLILMFFIFSFVGWCWEVSLHLVNDGVFVNRGTMYGPWLPIYGTGGVLTLVLLQKVRNNPPLTFVLTMIICGIVEYSSSWYLEKANGMRWWDYSGYLLNLNGRICLEGLLVFAIGGTIFIYIIAPLNDAVLNKIPKKGRIGALIVLLGLFGVDSAYSHFVPNSGKGITDYNTTGALLDYKFDDIKEIAATKFRQ